MMTTVFEIFVQNESLFYDLIDPLFLQKKISLFMSHLVQEILGPKVGLIVLKMY